MSLRPLWGLLALGVMAFVLPSAQALYIRPDLEKVPVERIVQNLEQVVAKDPKDAKAQFNLARVHAMAYALKTDTAEVFKGRTADGAWFGYEPKHIPFAVTKTEDADKLKA